MHARTQITTIRYLDFLKLSPNPLLCALLARLCRDHTGENDSRETKEGKDRYYVYLLTAALNMVLWSQNTDFNANSIMTYGNY